MSITRKTLLAQKKFRFNAKAKCIDFIMTMGLELENFVLVTNLTDNIIIYNPLCSGFGGSINTETNSLVFDYDTSTMSDDDEISVLIQQRFETVGINEDEIKVSDDNSQLLKEILVELKVNNEYLFHIYGDKINPEDVEISK